MTTIGRFNHNPTEKPKIRPKIRPFDDVPTENSPIERMSDTDIQSKPKENEICY